MNNEKIENRYFSEQIASRIIRLDGETHSSKVDLTHQALTLLLRPILSIHTIDTGGDVEYFDTGIVLGAIENDDATLLALIESIDTDPDYDLVNEVRALLCRSQQRQLDKWQADLAQCIDADLSQTIGRLNFLAEQGEKVSMIKNNAEFHFLSGYLAAVDQFASSQLLQR